MDDLAAHQLNPNIEDDERKRDLGGEPSQATQTSGRAGRPKGSKNKLKQQVMMMRECQDGMYSDVVEVEAGCDIVQCLADFCGKQEIIAKVLSANGMVSSFLEVGEHQQSRQGSFELVALSGVCSKSSCCLVACMLDPQGVAAGGMVAALTTAGPVTVSVASMVNASYHKLDNNGEDGDNKVLLPPVHGVNPLNALSGVQSMTRESVDPISSLRLPASTNALGLLPPQMLSSGITSFSRPTLFPNLGEPTESLVMGSAITPFNFTRQASSSNENLAVSTPFPVLSTAITSCNVTRLASSESTAFPVLSSAITPYNFTRQASSPNLAGSTAFPMLSSATSPYNFPSQASSPNQAAFPMLLSSSITPHNFTRQTSPNFGESTASPMFSSGYDFTRLTSSQYFRESVTYQNLNMSTQLPTINSRILGNDFTGTTASLNLAGSTVSPNDLSFASHGDIHTTSTGSMNTYFNQDFGSPSSRRF